MSKDNKDIDSVIDKPYTIGNILKMRLEGDTHQEIGDYFNVSKQAIHAKLKGLFDMLDQDNIQAYKKNKVALFTAVEMHLLQELVNAKRLKKASTGNIAYAFDKIAIHNRLEQGLSTENVAIKDVSDDLIDKAKQASDNLAKLKAKLAEQTVNDVDNVDN